MAPDILELVRARTKLVRSGRQWKACCILPGHKEKTPSFFVDPSKGPGVFYCWGCQKGGDVYELQSLLTGKPRSAFIKKKEPLNLRKLEALVQEVGRPKVRVQEAERLFTTARNELHALFKETDRILRIWKADRYPTRKNYKGSMQEYLDRHVEGYAHERLLLYEWRFREGKLRDPLPKVTKVLETARKDVRAVMSIEITPPQRSTRFDEDE